MVWEVSAMRARDYAMVLSVVLLVGVFVGQAFVKADNSAERTDGNKLAVLWTSGDADVAHKVCFMYTHAAKKAKWFDDVLLIVWGPSSRLLAGDKELQTKVKAMIASGVVVQACVACADMYGVADKLREIGIDVKPMGRPLSEMLKGDWKVLTF
jgi:hypothetical protein